MTKARDLADLLDASGNIIAQGTIDGRDIASDGSKLDSIEHGATGDQTHSEIRALITAGVDTNVFTDADHSKLDGIEAGATADQTAAEIKTAYESNANTNVFTDADHSKLAGIETGATADQTAAEIKTSYESNANTNEFSDAEQSKLAGIEAGATADQTASEIRSLVEAATDSNVFTDADHSKLNGIEAGATADQTKADIDSLNVDADTLDGQHGSYYTSYADTAVANIVDSAPGTLDTLNELAAALGDDPNFATTTATNIGTKANKTITVSAGSGLTGGGDLTANRTISHADTSSQASLTALTGAAVVSDIDVDTYGHVTGLATRNITLANLGYTGETNATADQTITAGSGLSGGGTGNVTLSHSDTSSQASVNNSGATVIQDVTLDTYGHVTGLASKAMTLADLGYTGATNANYITNNNQLTNGAGYTTYTANQALNTNSNPTFNDVYLADQIIHSGDTNTYMQFQGGDQWRVVTGGTQRLKVDNSQITSAEPIYAPSFHGDGSSLTGIASSMASLSDATVSTSDPSQGSNPSSGVGHIWINRNSGEVYVCTDATTNLNIWTNVGDGTGSITPQPATGGTVTTYSGYRVHTFTSSGTFSTPPFFSTSVNYLIVGGGGGGGYDGAGGGGGGAIRTGSFTVSANSNYSVTIGGGGGPSYSTGGRGSQGGTSSVFGTSSIGGGGGGSKSASGGSGASGGGGGHGYNGGGSGTSGLGNNGGTGHNSGGGGGGGFTSAGGTGNGGSGGAGGGNSLRTGSTEYYAGGGGGGKYDGGGQSSGGLGGGGNGGFGNTTAYSGGSNTGGGAGGSGNASTTSPRSGGSGIVVIRYAE